MAYFTIVILVFSILGALDRIFGNRLGIGNEFDKAFMLLGTMALSMIGMIVISPAIADVMEPISEIFKSVLHIDPSIIPASLFANDMGGANLAIEMANKDNIGSYNALVVSSMMGCTLSFTIPFSLGVVSKERHKELLLGLLCGIVTIPIGCIISGVICKVSFIDLLIDLLPIIMFAGIIAFGLVRFPDMSVKIFKVFGILITCIVTIGLSLGIIRFLTGYEVIEGLNTIEDGAKICVNAAVVLSGSFPLMFVLSKLLSRPFSVIGKKVNINKDSIVGLVSCIASSSTTFGMMDKMDDKGIVLNSAFAVSGAFVLGSHLAFTMAFDSNYVLAVVVGKLSSGISAIIFSSIIYNRIKKQA